MSRPLRTVLIGFGQVADGLGRDTRMRRYFGQASHAQVLADHPAFAWEAVVDPSADALARAERDWGIPHCIGDLAALAERYDPEVAVIAAPPGGGRAEVVAALPNLKAVMVEKPLGTSIAAGRELVALCATRGLPAQVNFWRRGVAAFRELAEGGLEDAIGAPQAAFGVYGNGLFNNASHLVDFVRMLLDDVREVRALAAPQPLADAPIAGDVQLPFAMRLASDITVAVQPLDFRNYREVGIDIWGTTGRLSLMQESLALVRYPLADNRGLEGAREIASDVGEAIPVAVDACFRTLYDNLAEAAQSGARLLSPASSALATEAVLHAAMASARADGRPQAVPA